MRRVLLIWTRTFGRSLASLQITCAAAATTVSSRLLPLQSENPTEDIASWFSRKRDLVPPLKSDTYKAAVVDTGMLSSLYIGSYIR